MHFTTPLNFLECFLSFGSSESLRSSQTLTFLSTSSSEYSSNLLDKKPIWQLSRKRIALAAYTGNADPANIQ